MIENKTIDLSAGAVFKTDLSDKPVRVIMYDDTTVCYETWWDHTKNWAYKSNLSGKVIYYRASTEDFLKTATFLHSEPLNDEEIAIHRPDLPLYVCRNANLKWSDKIYDTIEAYENYIKEDIDNTIQFSALNIPKIILAPFGLKGGLKKGVIIEARNGVSLSAVELLWNANNIEAPYITTPVRNGVGIYRQGFAKKIPSFYIWGFNNDPDYFKTAGNLS